MKLSIENSNLLFMPFDQFLLKHALLVLLYKHVCSLLLGGV